MGNIYVNYLSRYAFKISTELDSQSNSTFHWRLILRDAELCEISIPWLDERCCRNTCWFTVVKHVTQICGHWVGHWNYSEMFDIKGRKSILKSLVNKSPVVMYSWFFPMSSNTIFPYCPFEFSCNTRSWQCWYFYTAWIWNHGGYRSQWPQL